MGRLKDPEFVQNLNYRQIRINANLDMSDQYLHKFVPDRPNMKLNITGAPEGSEAEIFCLTYILSSTPQYSVAYDRIFLDEKLPNKGDRQVLVNKISNKVTLVLQEFKVKHIT